MNLHDSDEKASSFLVSPIITDIESNAEDAVSLAQKKLRSSGLLPHDARLSVFKRSVDARNRDRIRLVWTIRVTAPLTDPEILRLQQNGFHPIDLSVASPQSGEERLLHRPVIVGSGPAGLFCAYHLARRGYRPIIIERGGAVAERAAAVERFYRERILDPDDNIQFGAGGAGTFSDGKLMTRISDPHIDDIFRTFVSFGASPDILTDARPHIGTDVLRVVVERMIAAILSLGGEIFYHTRMTDIRGDSIVTNEGDIPFGVLILACGHSARDTYHMLLRRSFAVVPKAFSVGVRVEHRQIDIDRALYGRFAGHPALGHAAYALSCHTDDRRGVYTFCMCPGGYVVAAASEPGGVVVNGMSFHARDGENANAAVAVSVRESDYGNDPIAAIRFQQKIERAAYLAGGSDYSVPLSTMGDYLEGREATSSPSCIRPTYMDGQAYRLSSPRAYLPAFVCDGLSFAFRRFERTIPGFIRPEALITGPETRTSSPVRVLRTPSMTAVGFDRVYPCGEGAGYAGGITSAAADGIRCAEAVISRFRP